MIKMTKIEKFFYKYICGRGVELLLIILSAIILLFLYYKG